MGKEISKKLFDLIPEYGTGFNCEGIYTSEEKKPYLKHFFKGRSFTEAKKRIGDVSALFEQCKKGLYWFYFIVLFGWLFTLIGATWEKLMSWWDQGAAIKKFLDEECPYVEETKLIES